MDILEQQKHCCRGDDRSQCLIAVDGIHKAVQVQGGFQPQRQHPVEQPRRRSCQICQQTQPAVPDAVHQRDHQHAENAHRLKAAMPFLFFHTPPPYLSSCRKACRTCCSGRSHA